MPPKALMGVEAPPKRSKISLEAKLQVIKAIEDEPQTPKTRLAARLNLHYTTMMTIWADREKIKEAAMQGSAARKRVKVSKFVDLEKALVLWLHQVRRPGSAVNVYGTLVKAKAKTLALRLGIEGFTASNGWLFRFRKRNNVMFKKLCGESAEVDEDAVRRWSEQILPNLIKDYDLGDIYNADELGLFFNLMPDKSMVLDKDDEHGQSKARVTVLLGANATGTDKLPPLVIGKAKKPRCFAGIRTLPCPYSHNAKAWMNLQIFISWLKKLDGKMRATRRKIILFIDNCPAHPTSLGFLTNTRVEFLPKNTTSKLQPMDQGIFRTLKHYYRQKLVRRLLLMIDTGRPLQKKDVNVNLFQAMHFLMWAWEQVTPETIANCFGRAGVRKREVPLLTPDDQDEAAVDDPDGATDDAILYKEDGAERPQRCIDLPPLDDDLSERWVEVLNALELNPEMDFLEYVTADDGVKTSEELSDEDLVALAKPIEEEPDATAAEDEEEDEEMTPLSLVDGVKALEIVRRYMSQLQNLPDDVFATINKLEILAVSNSIATRKQKSITDLFHKL